MIVFCLGTQASGSTWVFNTVRSIAATLDSESVSFYSEKISDFIDNFEPVDGLIIIKCHSLDQRLLDLTKLLDVKIIVTTRDPRDSAVSQMERFSFNINQVVTTLSGAYSTISAIPEDFDILRLRYNEDLTFDADAVRRIATFIGRELDEETIAQIASQLSIDVIAERVEALAETGESPLWFERDTHWHPNHISDGRTGKWEERLTDLHREIIEAALLPLDDGRDLSTDAILWPPALFHRKNPDGREDARLVNSDGKADCLVWGPDFFLPAGRWKAEFLMEPDAGDFTVKIDINVPVPDRGVLGLKTFELRGSEAQEFSVEFDQVAHSHPIEARIHSVSDGQFGSFRFSGIRLIRCGPAPQKKHGVGSRIVPSR